MPKGAAGSDPKAPDTTATQASTATKPSQGPFGDLFSPDADPLKTAGSTEAIADKNVGSSVEDAKTFAQGFPRIAAQLGVSLGNAAENVPYLLYKAAEGLGAKVDPGALARAQQQGEQSTEFTPRGDGNVAVLGTDPIKGLASDVADAETFLRNSPFAQRTGLAKHSLAIAFPAVLGNEAFNLLSNFAGGEGELVDQLVKAGTDDAAANVLRKTGMDESIVQDFAPRFAASTDKAEVSDMLGVASKLQAASKGGEAADIARAAEDYVADSEATFEDGSAKAELHDDDPSTEAGDASAKAFDASADPAVLGKVGDAEVSIGTYGANAIARKAAAGLTDRLPQSEIAQTLPHVNAVYKAGTSSFRKDNMVMVAEMPDGTTRALITRQNAQGQEEVINFFNVGRDVNTFTKNLESYGVPERSRTSILGLENRSPVPLNDGRGDIIPQPGSQAKISPITSIRDAVKARVEGLMQARANPRNYVDPISEELPVVDVDDPAQKHGLYNVEDGDIARGPFKGWTEAARNLFQYEYVNTVRSGTRRIAGALARQQLAKMGFAQEAEAGEADILRFEGFERDPEDGQIKPLPGGPDRTDKFGKLSQMNDDLFQNDRSAGVQQRGKPIAYRSNYLRIYIRTPDGGVVDGDGNVIARAEQQGGRRVGRTAPFALPRTFATNAEALQAGYKLAFPNVPDLMAARTMEDYKAIGDAQLFNGASRLGMVIPDTVLPRDPVDRANFKMYDPERFPKYTTRYRDKGTGIMKEYVGPYWGPSKFVDKVNNFLHDPASGTPLERFGAGAARVTGTIKNAALSIGIPNLQKLGVGKALGLVIGKDAGNRIAQLGSGFSLHFWNLALSRAGLFEKALPQFFRYGADPQAAANYVQDHLDDALLLTKNGLTLSAEEHEMSAFDIKDLNTIAGVGRQAAKMSAWLHGLFGEGIFGKVMPAMKMQGSLVRTAAYVKRGMSPIDAMRRAADEENTIWGGTNLDQLGANKNTQNILRSLLIAPDYARTNVKIGVQAVRSLKNMSDESLSAYRSFATLFATSYVVANMIQYENTGTFMFQNDPLHIFSIKAGKDAQGRTRYVNLYGTGADAARIPLQVATAAYDDKINDIIAVVQNRLSIPVQSAESIFSNTDWSGQHIYGSDIYGNPIPTEQEIGNLFNETAGQVLPSSGQGLISLATGKISPEQAILQGLAVPVGYVNEKPNMTTIKGLEAEAKVGIANGDYTIFNQLVKAGVISSRTRASFIRDAVTGTKTERQQRTSAKAKAKLLKEEQQLESEGLDKNSI